MSKNFLSPNARVRFLNQLILLINLIYIYLIPRPRFKSLLNFWFCSILGFAPLCFAYSGPISISASDSSSISDSVHSSISHSSSPSTSTPIPASVPLSLFPIEHYSQNIESWINSNDPHYTTPLIPLSYQHERLALFYRHYFSTDKKSFSPWSEENINEIIQENNIVQKYLSSILERFSNKDKSPDKIGYGENFRPYAEEWIDKIKQNVNLSQFEGSVKFDLKNRGIMVQNALARALPTLEPHFYQFTLPGQGYPFDNLQMSAVFAGTPIYILGKTEDQSYTLILTPDFICWVESGSIGKANEQFISLWQQAAKRSLIAIIKTETPIMDGSNKSFRFKGFVGAVFPLKEATKTKFKILIPTRDNAGNAQIQTGLLDNEGGAIMPLAATRENFARLFKTLHQRSYGWGCLYFYNDCSAELKNLFTPFGFWLPRHSSDQLNVGLEEDKSSLSLHERLDYVVKNARPLMTLLFNGGHTFLYVGNIPNSQDPSSSAQVPLSYQNVWALKSKDSSYRLVIGKAVFLPLLPSYPEDPNAEPQVNFPIFKMVFLDRLSMKDEERIQIKVEEAE